MEHILEMPAFTVKDGVSEADFLAAHHKFNLEFMSVQKGYVSHKLVRDGDKWYDIAVWDSLESQEQAFNDIYENTAALEYIALIDQIGTDSDIPLFTVVRDY